MWLRKIKAAQQIMLTLLMDLSNKDYQKQEKHLAPVLSTSITKSLSKCPVLNYDFDMFSPSWPGLTCLTVQGKPQPGFVSLRD